VKPTTAQRKSILKTPKKQTAKDAPDAEYTPPSSKNRRKRIQEEEQDLNTSQQGEAGPVEQKGEKEEETERGKDGAPKHNNQEERGQAEEGWKTWASKFKQSNASLGNYSFF